VLTSLAAFALASVVFAFAAASPVVVCAGVAVWGLTFGGAATLLQTALADAAGDGADVALSMNVVAWNSAIAGGGVVGGILLERWGGASFPWALTFLLAVGFAIAWQARRVGFRPGHRLSSSAVEAN
jgi:predicted MFS family arabinose efflux permease